MYDVNKICEQMICKIKHLCDRKHMNPSKLAKEARVSTSTISYLLNRKTNPRLDTILLICNALDVSIGELFTAETKSDNKFQPENRKRKEELLQGYWKLSDEKKAMLEEYLHMLEQYKEEK